MADDQLATLTLKGNFLTITYTGSNVTKIIFSIVSKKILFKVAI